jgi:hypothetical protein
MNTLNTQTVVCTICSRTKPKADVISASLVHHAFANLIKDRYLAWSTNSHIGAEDLARFRSQYIQNVLTSETACALSTTTG